MSAKFGVNQTAGELREKLSTELRVREIGSHAPFEFVVAPIRRYPVVTMRPNSTLMLMALMLTGCSAPLNPPTPPILVGARAVGGWGAGGCPPRSETERSRMAKMGEARSPELESRLARQFPPGAPEASLKALLAKQGFKPAEACDNDPSIHRAEVIQSGGGFYGNYPAYGRVAWKVDTDGKIVWTKAQIAYTGP